MLERNQRIIRICGYNVRDPGAVREDPARRQGCRLDSTCSSLVESEEEDGSPVSFFQADNYFYYAKGVAGAMATVLEAILEDFHVTLESRHGTESLHHAIESCHWAAELNPWVVTESSLSGILANHRSNMAAPISHARFYLGVLIKTLST